MRYTHVPVFPLPGFVLFPRTMVPLHVYEPRYYRLVRDVLAGDAKFATANLRRGWEKDYFGAPPMFRVFSIARILDYEELPNKRFNIVIEGVERVRLLRERDTEGYRVLHVEPVVDVLPGGDVEPARALLREVVELAEELATHTPKHARALRNLENTHLHPGIIADQLASFLVTDGYDRQCLLEEARVLRRLQLIAVQLRQQLAPFRNKQKAGPDTT